jgi:hypothetical protein
MKNPKTYLKYKIKESININAVKSEIKLCEGINLSESSGVKIKNK